MSGGIPETRTVSTGLRVMYVHNCSNLMLAYDPIVESSNVFEGLSSLDP